MILKSVTINNYKSFGTINNKLIVEDGVTTIIGKNESGKSNILEALGKINFHAAMADAFNETNINRANRSSQENNTIVYNIELAFSTDEKSLFFNSDESTYIDISKDNFTMSGPLLELYKKELDSLFSKIIEFAKPNPFGAKVDNAKNLLPMIKILNNYTTSFPHILKLSLNSFFTWGKNLTDTSQKDFYTELITEAVNRHNKLLDLYPSFFYRNSNMILAPSYTLEQAKNELNAKNTLLSRLVKVLDIDEESFLRVIQNPNDDISIDLRDNIQEQINKKINLPFYNFYSQEKIRLTANFSNNSLKFSIKSNDGSNLPLVERSNGLKWYINLFIDMLYNDIPNLNIIFLIDEPGETLHVNAQRELLNLFNHLSETNQIIYTTHSPHMIEIKELHHIRAIQKDNTGLSSVFSSVCNPKLSANNQQDTLSPLLSAIGYDARYSILPSRNIPNIITEGITDYIYIQSFMKILNNCHEANIIPAIGASNIKNVCSILFGWGCDFIALFDYDNEGIEKGAKPLEKGLSAKYHSDYIYILDASDEQIQAKTYKSYEKMVIEDLISKSDWHKLDGLDCGLSDSDKLIKAKKIQTLLYSNCYIPDEKTTNNYISLFSRLGILVQ